MIHVGDLISTDTLYEVAKVLDVDQIAIVVGGVLQPEAPRVIVVTQTNANKWFQIRINLSKDYKVIGRLSKEEALTHACHEVRDIGDKIGEAITFEVEEE